MNESPTAQPGDQEDQAWLDHLAANIRATRARRDLTQEDLARKAGMRPNTVIDLEKSRSWPNVKTLLRLARALDVELQTLLP